MFYWFPLLLYWFAINFLVQLLLEAGAAVDPLLSQFYIKMKIL